MAVCNDFWASDSRFDTRRAILDRSGFPWNPTSLPSMLAALAGPPLEATMNGESIQSPSMAAYEYFSTLSSFTLSVKSSQYRFAAKDSLGNMLVETTKDLILPAGSVIPRGTQGVLLDRGDASTIIVTWRVRMSGWALLVEILQVAAGMRSADERSSLSPAAADFVHLSIGDLGIDGKSAETLESGLRLFRAVLQSSSGVTTDRFGTSLHAALLQIVLTVLGNIGVSDVFAAVTSVAIEVLQFLFRHSPQPTGCALRSSTFFGIPGRRRGIASAVIEIDNAKGEHKNTVVLLNFASSLITMPTGDTVLETSLLHLILTDIWSQYPRWRYRDIERKFEIASLLFLIFDTVLCHPIDTKSLQPTGAAKYLTDAFIHSASPITYRPLVEVLTQSGPMVKRLIAARRVHDAQLVSSSLDLSMKLMSTFQRIAAMLGTPANALPKNILAIPLPLFDTLFELAVATSSPELTKIGAIQLLRTWLEATSNDLHRLSMAGFLTDPEYVYRSLAKLLSESESENLVTYIWQLLATIIATQPGSASFCIGPTTGDKVPSILSAAAEQIKGYNTKSIYVSRAALTAVLQYMQAVLVAPATGKAILILREDRSFWQAVFDIATHSVGAPPTFTLSMHSEDFAARINQYAYSMQAKANATALLTTELASSEEDVETIVHSLMLSLFRNASALEEAAISAVHSSCSPQLHDVEAKKLVLAGNSLAALKSVCLPSEREYGRTYLYGRFMDLFQS